MNSVSGFDESIMQGRIWRVDHACFCAWSVPTEEGALADGGWAFGPSVSFKRASFVPMTSKLGLGIAKHPTRQSE